MPFLRGSCNLVPFFMYVNHLLHGFVKMSNGEIVRNLNYLSDIIVPFSIQISTKITTQDSQSVSCFVDNFDLYKINVGYLFLIKQQMHNML